MADLDDIDALLSSSLKSAAEPATSTGVAEAIRARVASGDVGTAATAGTAPGWGGGGVVPWLPWIGAVIVAGAVGGSLGALGYFGNPVVTVPADDSALVTSSLLAEAPFAVCPGGDAVGTLPAGARVLAVQRDDSTANVGVRDPYDISATLWLPVQLVTPDDGQPAMSSLPVGDACPVYTIETQTPSPEPTPTETEAPNPPNPPADTVAPKINSIAAVPTLIINDQPTTITVSASDNVGVSGVTLSWSTPNPNAVSGSAPMSLVGGVWTYSYSNPNLSNGFGNITFVAKASDAAGNQSPTAQVVVNRQYLG